MDNIFDRLFFLPPPFNMVVLILLIIFLANVIIALAKEARRYACHRADHQFKLELLQNGLSAEEAERWLALSVADRNAPASKGGQRDSTKSPQAG